VTYRPGPRDLRASDFDRERVIALLGESVADGRLTPEEHTDRVERAYQARTLGELAVLTTDLAAPSGQPIRLDGRRAVAAVFGHDSRNGRWVVPEALPVVTVFGEAELDLREAILQGSRTVIYATVVLGTLHLIVPDGVSVEISGTAVLTRKISRTIRQPGAPRWPGAQRQPGAQGGNESGVGSAVIELRTVGIGGTIRVTSPRPPRRLGGLRRGLSR
jgi:Domain of unknown function (DUF1707)/Cell wall-active antibiotics response 4TMS YvqF